MLSVLKTTITPCVSLVLATLLAMFAGAATASSPFSEDNPNTATPAQVTAAIKDLAEADREALLDFVAGNALFTLYHEAGHMLVSELELPVLGKEEDAADNFAAVSMLQFEDETVNHLLSAAMDGWFLLANKNEVAEADFAGEHSLDIQRGYKVLCLMVGKDAKTFGDLAVELELEADRIESCAQDYADAEFAWAKILEPHQRADNDPDRKIKVVYGPAPVGMQLLTEDFKTNELMELVAEELDAFYKLPEPVVFRAVRCGEENAFWHPQKREMHLCYERLNQMADLYLRYLKAEQ